MRIILLAVLMASSLAIIAQTNTFPTSGNVGIGTISPNAKLDIVGGALWVSQSSNQRLEITQNFNNDGTAIFNNRASIGDMKFQFSGTNRFTIKRNGNVGIGTTSPSTKLNIIDNSSSEVLRIESSTNSSQIKLSSTGTGGLNWSLISTANGASIGGGKFSIYGNSQHRLILDQGGNVGIGTANPEAKLHINAGDYGIKSDHGVAIVESNDAQLDLISSADGSWGSAINFIEGNGSSNSNIWSIARRTTDGTGISNLHFNFGAGNSQVNTNKMLLYSEGKVDINSSVSGKALRLLGDNMDLDFHIGHNGESHAFYWRYKGTGSGNLNDLELWSNNQGGSDLMIYNIHQDGNVNFHQKIGIGTDNTGSHKLAVEGSIGAREIKVEASGWSDFVFEKDYDLRSLEEVENHIAEKGHLPDVPSEAEVMENGINLGEMNAKLLQKIEELTLYLIEQNKELKSLKEKNEELEKRLEKVED